MGYGGAFDWSTGTNNSGTQFNTFCSEIQQNISANHYYNITTIFTPTTGGTLNSLGNILSSYNGLYDFNQWATGALATQISSAGGSTVAGAVQVAIWQSESFAFYSTSQPNRGSDFPSIGSGITYVSNGGKYYYENSSNNDIVGYNPLGSATSASSYYDIGYSLTNFQNAYNEIANLGTMPGNWTPASAGVKAFELQTSGGSAAQDQVVLTSQGTTGGSGVPEPTTLLIWGAGAAWRVPQPCVAANHAAALVGRKPSGNSPPFGSQALSDHHFAGRREAL